MNNRGQEDIKAIFGWILVAILVIFILVGFFSSNVCNRLLIGVGFFGLIWLFFGSPILTRIEHRSGWVIFLPISVVLFILWIILKATGVCTPATELWEAIKQLFSSL